MRCKKIDIDKLKPGATVTAAVVDPAQPRLKLIAEGTVITDHLIAQLKRRGIQRVILSERDIAVMNAFQSQGRRTKVPPSPTYQQSMLHNEGSQEADAIIRDGKIEGWDEIAASSPANHDQKPAAGTDYADGLQSQWASESDHRIDVVTECTSDSLQSHNPDVTPLKDTSGQLVDRWMEDPDALVALAVCPYPFDYPTRHGVHLASLAISLGANLGLDRKQLIDLSTGCLVHDVGMQAVGVNLFDTKDKLSFGQLRRLSNHPVKAIEVATKYGDSLSLEARMVLYQIHERCDGSGYPRGYHADQIHPLAKIASVADAFVGMVSPRKHRYAIQGFSANIALMEDAKKGKYDARVIRALLHATSLHPIGSRVELSNGRVGQVVRSGGTNFVSPTIRMWSPDRSESEPAIVDLATEPSIQITRSLPAAA